MQSRFPVNVFRLNLRSDLDEKNSNSKMSFSQRKMKRCASLVRLSVNIGTFSDEKFNNLPLSSYHGLNEDSKASIVAPFDFGALDSISSTFYVHLLGS